MCSPNYIADNAECISRAFRIEAALLFAPRVPQSVTPGTTDDIMRIKNDKDYSVSIGVNHYSSQEDKGLSYVRNGAQGRNIV
jgi:hypothetical protein